MNLGMYNGSRADNWRTPDSLWEKLDEQYRFTFDVAAAQGNSKTERYWDEKSNALQQNFAAGERYWMNPPFSQGKHFFEKIGKEIKKGIQLIAIYKSSNLEAAVWQDHILPHCSWVLFIRGRVNFANPRVDVIEKQVPFGSALIGYGLEPPVNVKGTLWWVR